MEVEQRHYALADQLLALVRSPLAVVIAEGEQKYGRSDPTLWPPDKEPGEHAIHVLGHVGDILLGTYEGVLSPKKKFQTWVHIMCRAIMWVASRTKKVLDRPV